MLWRLKFQKILRIYADWAKSILDEQVKIEWCSDFYCLPSYPYKIWIGMLIKEDNIEELYSFYQDNFNLQFNIRNFEIFVLNFLHECGHISSDWEFDDIDNTYDRKNITTKEYRRLPKEWRADEWVIDYITNNGMSVHKWQTKLKQAYSKITKSDLDKWTKNRIKFKKL